MLRSLRIFSDLAETGSFTETAHRNYLTQSAVSQHLKALESKLGHRLLERRHHQAVITPAGTLVYDAAQEILKRYGQLEASLRQAPKREVTGTVRVGSIYTTGFYKLPAYVKSFLKRYPKVDLLLSYLKDSEVYQGVLDERLDLGVVDDPRPHPHLTVTPFTKERIVLVVPPKHPWARKRRVSLEQLSGQPFVLMAHDGSTMKDLLRQAHVRVKIVRLLDNIEIVKRAVEVGSGVALVPQIAVADDAKVGRLKPLDLAEGPIERTIGIVARKGATLSMPAQKFVQTLLSSRVSAGAA
ncbi:MAG: LysR family transcriptional regulator [Candidatus Omnitrophica bacterium]|nr:LysR family transcriptional regulator [Candidatus Omnitrophota bacterium]